VPASLAAETIVLPYNDLDAVADALTSSPGEVAALIVEPYPANCGLILPLPGYLEGLRKLCSEHGVVLIFDEVMTGFRLTSGGVQKLTGITPDLTALGKIIGGGLPVGAFGGKEEIMNHLAPLGPVYQAGTLSGNPLAMAAGIASLKLLKKTNPYDRLDCMGQQLARGLISMAKDRGIPLQVPQIGSMYCLFFTDEPVTEFEQAVRAMHEHFNAFFHHCLENGLYLPPSSYETCFISTAHDSDTLEKTLDIFQRAFSSFH